MQGLLRLVSAVGVEPTTFWLKASYSAGLSYAPKKLGLTTGIEPVCVPGRNGAHLHSATSAL